MKYLYLIIAILVTARVSYELRINDMIYFDLIFVVLLSFIGFIFNKNGSAK